MGARTHALGTFCSPRTSLFLGRLNYRRKKSSFTPITSFVGMEVTKLHLCTMMAVKVEKYSIFRYVPNLRIKYKQQGLDFI